MIRALDGHKFDDMFAHGGEFRASDHMVVHDLYVAKVEKPGAAKRATCLVRDPCDHPGRHRIPGRHGVQNAGIASLANLK